jgi:thioredoxin-dependent peroxiredoxin
MTNRWMGAAAAALAVAACAPGADAGEAAKGARVEAGQKAPDFRAPASDGGEKGLSDFAGKVVVLYFYPKDDTPGCTIEAKDFRDFAADFAAAGAAVVGVSADDLESHGKFAKKHGLAFTLLSDPDGRILDAYGAWKEGSIFGRTAMGVDRSTFVIDGTGTVRRAWRSVNPMGHAQEVLAFVRSLSAGR